MKIEVEIYPETLEEAAYVFARLAHPSLYETVKSGEWQFLERNGVRVGMWRIVDGVDWGMGWN